MTDIKKVDSGRTIRFESLSRVELLAFVSQFTLKEKIYNLPSMFLIRQFKDREGYYSDYYGENYEKAKAIDLSTWFLEVESHSKAQSLVNKLEREYNK